MRAARERRKCADCPATTTRVYCRMCARQHAKPAGSVTLFSGSHESNKRRRAVLDAIDLVPLIDRDGWVKFLTWCERVGYENDPRGGAAGRQWERLKARLREHGIDVEAREASEASEYGSGMRFTVDGWDRLQALVKALDDWLCAVRPEEV